MENVKERIAEIVGIENSSAWEIFDSDEENSLYLIHYVPNADLAKWGFIRGIVISLDKQMVVCRTFGHTPTVTMKSIAPDDNNRLNLQTLNEPYQYTIDLNDKANRISIFRGIEPVVVRAFLWNDQFYLSSFKKLNVSNSKLINNDDNPTFLEMYQQMNGPSRDQLFESSTKFSPYVHIMGINHPSTLIASRFPIGKGGIAYLETVKVWNETEVDLKSVDTEVHKPKIHHNFFNDGQLFRLSELSFDEANSHLQSGVYDADQMEFEYPFMGLGEFVVVYHYVSGLLTNVIRVESPAYSWRHTISAGNTNLNHRLYDLMDNSRMATNTRPDFDRFVAQFGIYT
jgi:hypothetical protein